MDSEGSEEYNVNDGYGSDGYNGIASLQSTSRVPWEVPHFSPRTSVRYAEHRKSRASATSSSAVPEARFAGTPPMAAAAKYDQGMLQQPAQAAQNRPKRYSEIRRVSSLLHQSQEAMQQQSAAEALSQATNRVAAAPAPSTGQDVQTDAPKRKSYAEMRRASSLANGLESQVAPTFEAPEQKPVKRYSELRKARASIAQTDGQGFFDPDALRGRPSESPSTGSARVPALSARASTSSLQASTSERGQRYSMVRKSKSLAPPDSRGASVYDPDRDAWVPAAAQPHMGSPTGPATPLRGPAEHKSMNETSDAQRWQGQWMEDLGRRLQRLEDTQLELRGDVQRLKESPSTKSADRGKISEISQTVKKLDEQHDDLGIRMQRLETDLGVYGDSQKKLSLHLDNVELDLARHFASLRDEVKSRIQASEQRLLAKVLKDVEERFSASPMQVRTPAVQPFDFQDVPAEHVGLDASPRLRSSASSVSSHQRTSFNEVRHGSTASESQASRRSLQLRSKAAILEAEDAGSEASVSEMSRHYIQLPDAQHPAAHPSRSRSSQNGGWQASASARGSVSRQMPQQRATSDGWEPGSKDSEGRLVF